MEVLNDEEWKHIHVTDHFRLPCVIQTFSNKDVLLLVSISLLWIDNSVPHSFIPLWNFFIFIPAF